MPALLKTDAPFYTDAELDELEATDPVAAVRDGGDIEFVSLEERTLTVRLKGSCAGCPRAPLDLKHVVEELVRRHYPQITVVRNV